MIKFHDNYKKLSSKFRYKYMTVTLGNLLLDIPLSLPITYGQEFKLKQCYWDYGTEVLMEN